MNLYINDISYLVVFRMILVYATGLDKLEI